ncbi:MAG: carboxypeptidase regulatory-like domain-containing protein [Spirochaetales bacterium]|nr:carboxypeptidase regulatory-like domain-containing protein [Spirochaetales bacterium]
MKKGFFYHFTSFIYIVIAVICTLVLSCRHPGDEIPAIDTTPRASLAFANYIDPFIVEGKPFRLCLSVDLYYSRLKSFDIIVSYDETMMLPIENGVESGNENLSITVDTVTPGMLRIQGNHETWFESGEDIGLLIAGWDATAQGETDISAEIVGLAAPDGSAIESEKTIHFTIDVDESVSYPLTGRVLDSIGGAPVGGASVEVSGTGLETTTDSDGFFRFENIVIGVYDIVATKEGRAGSRLQEVYVDGDDIDVEIVQCEYNYLIGSVTPPSIEVSGVDHGGEYTGLVPVDIRVIEGSSPVFATEFHRSIYLKIGTTSMSYYEVAESPTDTLYYRWNTQTLPAGPVVLKAVAYDTNNNRAEINIPLSITTNNGVVPEMSPYEDFYNITATTYGKSMVITRSPGLSAIIGGAAYPATRAPEDTSIIVEFSVQKYYHGIVIYKSAAEEGPYALAGQTTYTDSFFYKFADYSPALMPDMTVYYKLAYFNQYGMGPPTDAISVRILPAYHISLAGPPNNAIITEITPTLTWESEPVIEGARRTDWIVVTNVLDATIVAYSFIDDGLEYTLPALQYNNKYEWDVRSLYEYNNAPPRANVLSRSFPGGKGFTDLSLNGSFYFTVVQPEE